MTDGLFRGRPLLWGTITIRLGSVKNEIDVAVNIQSSDNDEIAAVSTHPFRATYVRSVDLEQIGIARMILASRPSDPPALLRHPYDRREPDARRARLPATILFY